MNTKNQYFNNAWVAIAGCHPSAHLPNGESIDLSKYPAIVKKDWVNYIHSLIDLVIIGKRNSYLHLHQDGKGRGIYLYVSKENQNK